MQLNNKQIYPANTFVENNRQNLESQWAMGNVTFVSKKFKNFSFFDENWTDNYFWYEPPQHAAKLKGFPSMSAEMLAFQSLL